jgi:8-oxo-dGTP diphosphatase
MTLPVAQLTVELIPHCTSVARAGWTGNHDARPFAELGFRQAEALVTVIGADVDGIYSSPAARCRQTVAPLAAAARLPVRDLAELYEAGDFSEPGAGLPRAPDVMVRAVGGAWAAGRMLRAISTMMGAHPGGRVVAASHGDVIPVTIICGADDPRPWTATDSLLASLPGGSRTVLSGAGHAPWAERPDDTRRLVAAALRSAPAR